jgi:hypothetical protein
MRARRRPHTHTNSLYGSSWHTGMWGPFPCMGCMGCMGAHWNAGALSLYGPFDCMCCKARAIWAHTGMWGRFASRHPCALLAHALHAPSCMHMLACICSHTYARMHMLACMHCWCTRS